MIATKPVRRTTAALLARAASDFQAELQRIADMAVLDGEAPVGSNLNTTLVPAVWEINVPDIAPPSLEVSRGQESNQ